MPDWAQPVGIATPRASSRRVRRTRQSVPQYLPPSDFDHPHVYLGMRFSVLVLALALGVGCKSTGREATANNPVKWTLSPSATELRPDSVTSMRLAATIDKGWYIYSITQKAGGPTPMTVTVEPSPPFHIQGDVEGPAPVVVFDKEFNINTERYEGTPSFLVPVAATIAEGTQPSSLDIKVRFQACNETLCLPARSVTLTSRAQVAVQ